MNELGETGTLLFDANAMQLSSENGVIWLSQEDIEIGRAHV